MNSYKKITAKGLNASSGTLLPPGCVVISSRAPIGYVALSAISFCTNQGCKVLKPNTEYSSEFCYYNILFNVGKLRALGEGTTFAEISKAAVSAVKLPFPICRHEQEKIACILLKTDEAISNTESYLAKQYRIKNGLIETLTNCGIDDEGRIRKAGSHSFKNTPVGLIPEDWDVRELGRWAFVTKLAGFEFTKHFDYNTGGDIIALRALNIKRERLDLSDVQRIPREVSNKLPRSKVYANDILITYIGAYIGDILRIEEDDKYHLAPNIAKIVVGREISSWFLEWVLRSQRVRAQIKNLTAVTATPSLTMTQIRKLLIAAPKDTQEQQEIAKRIQEVADAINLIEEQVTKLRRLKAALMQDLLTGKKRVTALLDQELRREKVYA